MGKQSINNKHNAAGKVKFYLEEVGRTGKQRFELMESTRMIELFQEFNENIKVRNQYSECLLIPKINNAIRKLKLKTQKNECTKTTGSDRVNSNLREDLGNCFREKFPSLELLNDIRIRP